MHCWWQLRRRRKDTWSLQALYCCFPSRFVDIYVDEWKKGEEYDPQWFLIFQHLNLPLLVYRNRTFWNCTEENWLTATASKGWPLCQHSSTSIGQMSGNCYLRPISSNSRENNVAPLLLYCILKQWKLDFLVFKIWKQRRIPEHPGEGRSCSSCQSICQM